MSASQVFLLLRVPAVKQVLAFEKVPDLFIRSACYIIDTRIWLRNHASNVPNVNAIAPRRLEAYFWRPIDIWLHVLVMLDISRNGRAKVTQERLPNALTRWGVECSGGVDCVPPDVFPGRWAFLFSLDEFLDDRFVVNS